MTTLADIRDRIKSDLTLSDTEDYDSQIISALQSALRQLRGKRYWFLRAYSTLTGSANSETLNITNQIDDFSVAQSVDMIYNGKRFYPGNGFNLISFDSLREQYWTTSTIASGTPEACAVENSTLYLSHLCPSGATFPIVYYKQDASMPGANDTTIWNDDGQDVLRELGQYIFLRNSQGVLPQEANADLVTAALKALDLRNEAMSVGSY